MKKYECFEISIEKQIAHVRLSRPEKRNSMNSTFWNELPEIISNIDNEVQARVILISSLGPHFCAGLDTSIFQSDIFQPQSKKTDGDTKKQQSLVLMNYISTLQKALSCFQKCRLPVITAIQGGCIGGGLDLVCASDIRLGTENCYFSILETKLGLVADIGTFPRIVNLMPEGLVKELAFTGRNFLSKEALQSGFLNKLFSTQEELLEYSFTLAQEISKNSPLAVFGSKEVINYSKDHKIQESLDWIKMWNASMLNFEDIQEGFKSSFTGNPGDYCPLPKKFTRLS